MNNLDDTKTIGFLFVHFARKSGYYHEYDVYSKIASSTATKYLATIRYYTDNIKLSRNYKINWDASVYSNNKSNELGRRYRKMKDCIDRISEVYDEYLYGFDL